MKLKKFLKKWRINKFYPDKSNNEIFDIFEELKIIIQDEEKAIILLILIRRVYAEVYCISMFNNLILRDVFNVYKRLLCLGFDVETAIEKGNNFFEIYKKGSISFDDLYNKFLSGEYKNIEIKFVKMPEFNYNKDFALWLDKKIKESREKLMKSVMKKIVIRKK